MANVEQGRHRFMVAVQAKNVALRTTDSPFDFAQGRLRRLSPHKASLLRYCPKISGRPFLLLPITTTLEFGLFARFSVASIPFHSSNEGVMPCATIC